MVSVNKALAALEASDRPAARKLVESTIATRGCYGDSPSRSFRECPDKSEPLPGGVVDRKEK